jgi:predicted nucleic acid-binding protein
VNVAEVFYILWQRRGEERARGVIANLSRSSVQFVPIDLMLALKAGEIKVLHNLSLVDSMAAALAIVQQASLVTCDRDFEKLGRHFPITWIMPA